MSDASEYLLDRSTRQFYDEDAAGYDERRWSTRAGRYNNKVQLDLVRRLLDSTDGCFLEIGSGTGRFSAILAERAEALYLLDVADRMLRTAMRRAPCARPVLGDISCIPLTDASVGVVVCLNVLSHIRDLTVAIGEIARVLRPGGLALLNFNNLTSTYALPGLIVNARGRSFRADVHSRWQPWTSFRSLLRSHGLEVRASLGHMPFPTWTPGALVPPLALIDRMLRRVPQLAPLPFVMATRAGKPGNWNESDL